MKSGEEEALRLIGSLGFTKESYLLEIGCGPGRLPIGILKVLGETNYQGVDVDKRAIDWCKKHISASHPAFKFDHINARNERYNPQGIEMNDSFSLPYGRNSFDIAYLHSVFTNMIEKDVRIYIKEFRRLLKQGGRLFLTAYVEERVPDITVNPDNYGLPGSGPLYIVRYEKVFFLSLFRDNGFSVERFDHGTELDGQSGLYLRSSA